MRAGRITAAIASHTGRGIPRTGLTSNGHHEEVLKRRAPFSAWQKSSAASSRFSTFASDDNDLTPNQDDDEKVRCLISELNFLGKTGQAKKAEDTLKKFLEQNDQKKTNLLSEEELTTCYNHVLWAYSLSKTGTDVAPAAERILKSMLGEPNMMTYRHMLKCWSRSSKTTKSKHAGQQAERCLRQLQSMGVAGEDLGAAYHLAIKACTKTGDGIRALQLLKEMAQMQEKNEAPVVINRHVMNSVLMANKDKPSQAEAILMTLEQSGLQLESMHYCTVMDGWAKLKNGERVEGLTKRMLSNGIKPSVGASRALMKAWRGNVDRQEQLFRALMDDYLNCPFRRQQQPHPQQPVPPDKLPQSPTVAAAAAVQPDVESLSIVLSAQAQATDPMRAETLLNDVLSHPEISTVLKPNVVCYASVMDSWARAHQPQNAERIMRQSIQSGNEPTAAIYNTAMHAWALAGNIRRTMALWDEMRKRNIQPNNESLNSLVLAFANAKQPKGAFEALDKAATESGLVLEYKTYGMILKLWADANQPGKARELLDLLRQREKEKNVTLLDTFTYNTVIHGFSKAGMPEEAEKLLSEMLESKGGRIARPDEHTFMFVLSAYTKSKDVKHHKMASDRAESLMQLMQEMGIEPSSLCFNVFLHCFSLSGQPERAQAVLKNMMLTSSLLADVVSLNTCLNAWARVGNAEKAERLLCDIGMDKNVRRRGNYIEPDAHSFSIVLAAWSRQASIESAQHAEALLRHMATLRASCNPDTVAYNTVLQAWLNVASEFGRRDVASLCAKRADRLFSEMEEHGRKKTASIRPDRISYLTMIRLWSLAENKEQAEQLKAQLSVLRKQQRR